MASTRTPRKVSSPYVKAKNLLSASYVDNLVGRDEEFNHVHNLIEKALNGSQSYCFYISGPAGTGKSLTVSTVIENLKKSFNFKYININCMAFQSAACFYEKILSNFERKPKRVCRGVGKQQNDFTSVVNELSQFPNMTILVLDEIDQLPSKNHDVLNNIFRLPSILKEKIVLIGIANALDFTAKMLWLKDFEKKNFHEIRFVPYKKDQIVQIIEHRLKCSANTENILIDKSAIEFCARKIASCSGDIRKALDVCRRAIELLENNLRSFPENINTTPLKSSDFQKNIQIDSSNFNKHVDVKLMINALNKVYGTAVDKIDTNSKVFLPSDQQVIICTLLVLWKTKSLREVKLSQCRQVLAKICSKRGISSEGKSESDILNMCQFLSDYGYVSVKKESSSLAKGSFGRTPKKNNTSLLSLQIDPFEAEQLLSSFHKTILSSAESYI